MLYFGYGSNLNLADLRRWCAEKGHRSEGVKPITRAWLPDHELVFHYRSRARKGGALSVRSRRGSAVPGVAFEVDEAGWRALDAKEGAGLTYERVERTALGEDGNELEVVTYVVTEEYRREHHVPPTEAYRQAVREGLEMHGLPTRQLDAAARGLEIPAFPRALFVYGTLMRGELRHPMIARHRPARLDEASAAGRLVHLGEYPGLVVCARGGRVRGELVELHDPGDAFAELDDVEDFLGYGVEGSLYRRVLLDVEREDGSEARAWTYRYLGDGASIPSGDWRRR